MAFAFVVAALAAFGAMRLAVIVFVEGSARPLLDARSDGFEWIGVVVFAAAIALLLKGVDQMRQDRMEKTRRLNAEARGSRAARGP